MDSINGIAAQLGRTNRDLYKVNEELTSRIKRLEKRVQNHQEELVATHSLLGSMCEQMDSQAKRIERLILVLAKGTESSTSDPCEGTHTHWVYPLNREMCLLVEMGGIDKKGLEVAG